MRIRHARLWYKLCYLAEINDIVPIIIQGCIVINDQASQLATQIQKDVERVWILTAIPFCDEPIQWRMFSPSSILKYEHSHICC